MTPAPEALQRFLRSTGAFAALLDAPAELLWRERPAGEEWSLAETVEHVVLTNEATLARFRDRLLASPFPAGAERFADERITEEMFRGPAPPGLAEPRGRFATRDEGVAALVATRDAIETVVAAQGERLRGFALPHPVFGTFDGVQWVLFLAAHTDNHVPQLARLRAPRPSPAEVP